MNAVLGNTIDAITNLYSDSNDGNKSHVTLESIIYVIIFGLIIWYITDYFIQHRLIRWIYVGTIAVIGITLYNKGQKLDAAKDIFKLAFI